MAKRILLVEDSPVIQAAVTNTLAAAGYEVATRSNFNELMAEKIGGFDLILMDVQMPELYGDDVASVLRNERKITTPIYLFSSLPPTELDERAKAAGVDGFIHKGDGLDHLLDRVRTILA
jgi:DNA-binding response OmpR family regulator